MEQQKCSQDEEEKVSLLKWWGDGDDGSVSGKTSQRRDGKGEQEFARQTKLENILDCVPQKTDVKKHDAFGKTANSSLAGQ